MALQISTTFKEAFEVPEAYCKISSVYVYDNTSEDLKQWNIKVSIATYKDSTKKTLLEEETFEFSNIEIEQLNYSYIYGLLKTKEKYESAIDLL